MHGLEGGRRKTVSVLGCLGMGSWRRQHPMQRKCLEVEDTVGDGGRAWRLPWPENRELWETQGRECGLENGQEGSQEDLDLCGRGLPTGGLLPGGL